MTDESFDPYFHWLGIPPQEQPPDHYRLLGLARFESDPLKIEAASDERMVEIRRYQSGPRMAYTQRLLKEISIARLCLLDIQSKASYDTVLRGRQSLNSIGWEETPPPQHLPQPPATPSPYAMSPPYAAGPQPFAAPQPYQAAQPYAAPPPPHTGAPSYPAQTAVTSYPHPHYPPAYDSATSAPQFPTSQFGPPSVAAPPAIAPPPVVAPSSIAPPPIASPPVASPPVDDAGAARHAERLSYLADSSTRGPQGAGERRPATRKAGKRVKAASDRTVSGSRELRSARGRAAQSADPDGTAGGAGESLEEAPSLFRSSWFLPTLILLGVGGILAMWIVVRSGAFQSEKQAADNGERDGLIEESVEDMDAVGNASGGGAEGSVVVVGKNALKGASGGRQTARSTIDNPFGAVELIQEGTGELHFTAQTAELVGGGLALETRGDEQVVSGWATAEQTLVWNFRLAKPDIFRVELVYAAGDESRGAQFALQVDDEEPKANEVAPTGASDKFRTDILHLTVRRSGKHQLRLAIQDLPMGGLVAVKSLRFIPKGLSDRKK